MRGGAAPHLLTKRIILMRLLFIGDVVGKPGRKALRELLPGLKNEFNVDIVLANVENAAGGAGVTKKVLDEILRYGVHVMTGGNHIWDKKEIFKHIDDYPTLLRPANYPPGAPGNGFIEYTTETGLTITVINLMGRLFVMNIDCPFRKFDEITEKNRNKIVIVDFHAETTAEKQAFAYYVDGRASLVVGTHTHVQTADEKILPGGTGYITDLGMTGGLRGVIGIKKDLAIQRFITQLPVRYEPSNEEVGLEGVFVEIDNLTGKALKIERIRRYLK